MVETSGADSRLTFGLRIKQFRTLIGMTQGDFAGRCGIAKTYLSRIENGLANPTLTLIVAVAGTLGLSPVDLLADGPPRQMLLQR
jgi:transcriptional regulator with XRE-family HTH domain